MVIGDDIEVNITDIRGDRVRLAIKAPKEIPVHRKEIYLAIQAEKVHQLKLQQNLKEA
ncbi:MAG: carbon storage regulator [Sedimentisphaerales bacterium]|nr:carbon storage regulator [Sedimentisphaerales bacterium]